MNEDLECRVVGQMDNTEDHTFESANRVYDKEGLCPTIPTGAGGGHTPKILTECASLAEKRFVDIYNKKEIKSGVCITLTAHGNASPTTCGTVAVVETGEKVVKGEIIQGGLQEHQHPRKDGISPSITAACGMGGGQTPIFTERHGTRYRIRKLTPRECGRLMGVKDSDIDKMAAVNSNTQLYKQFGNSIVVDVMCAMFRKMNIRGVDSMSERYEKKEVEDD